LIAHLPRNETKWTGCGVPRGLTARPANVIDTELAPGSSNDSYRTPWTLVPNAQHGREVAIPPWEAMNSGKKTLRATITVGRCAAGGGSSARATADPSAFASAISEGVAVLIGWRFSDGEESSAVRVRSKFA
jgi:hypothetical protein